MPLCVARKKRRGESKTVASKEKLKTVASCRVRACEATCELRCGSLLTSTQRQRDLFTTVATNGSGPPRVPPGEMLFFVLKKATPLR